MTLLRESDLAERSKETAERKVEAPQPPVDRVRWIEWLVAVALLVGGAALVIFLGPADDVVPDSAPVLLTGRADPAVPEYLGASGGDLPVVESSPLVLGFRMTEGTAFTPEYLGASGGDLPFIESSPLVMGPRMDGVAHTPEFLGLSGGDAPVVETSPLTMGVRHLGVVHVPEYLGSSETEVPTTP